MSSLCFLGLEAGVPRCIHGLAQDSVGEKTGRGVTQVLRQRGSHHRRTGLLCEDLRGDPCFKENTTVLEPRTGTQVRIHHCVSCSSPLCVLGCRVSGVWAAFPHRYSRVGNDPDFIAGRIGG